MSADNKIGAQLAVEALHEMRTSNDPHMLLDCVGSMIEHGRFGGVEVGFLLCFGC